MPDERLRTLVRTIPDPDGAWILAPGGTARLDTDIDGAAELSPEQWDLLSTNGLLEDHFSDWYGVTLVMTTACNLRCWYCFQNTGVDERTGIATRIPSRTMTTEVIRGSAEFARRHMEPLAARRVVLTLFGGEPLLAHPRCLEALTVYRELFDEVDALMVTNAVRLDLTRAEKLHRAGLTQVQITLDGPRSTHDRTRISRAEPQTFDTIVGNTIDLVRKTGINILLRINVTTENAFQLPELLEELGTQPELTSSRVGLDLAPVRGYPWNAPDAEGQNPVSALVHGFQRARDMGFGVITPGVRACIYCAYRDFERGVVVGPDGALYSNWSAAGRADQVIGTLTEGPRPESAGLWKSCMDFDADEGAAAHGLSDSDDYIRAVLRMQHAD